MSYLNKIRPLFVDGERSPLRSLKDIATIEKIDGVKFFLPPGVKSRVFKQTRSDMEWLQTELGLVFEINHEQMLRKHEPLFKEKTLSSISLLISDLVKKTDTHGSG